MLAPMKRYPFTAIVGQDEMKSALLLAAVDPSIGGVLAFGDRGAGKSTAVRALAALLPSIECVAGLGPCAAPTEDWSRVYADWSDRRAAVEARSTPLVDLPLGATEDRVVGALDLERALAHGEAVFEPGLLARAHRGFLYVDEVNLLEDHLVDLLLDVAASGENVVEREAVSVRHPARFVLVGSGNPEEGELRPQLLDRFGLSVPVETPSDVPSRVEIVRRRDAFDRDPEGFAAAWADAEAETAGRIVAARGAIDAVETPVSALEAAARLCLAIGSDGVRGELTILRAARARAALRGASAVEVDDVRAVAPMALRHRLRRDPLDDVGSDARLARALDEALGASDGAGRPAA